MSNQLQRRYRGLIRIECLEAKARMLVPPDIYQVAINRVRLACVRTVLTYEDALEMAVDELLKGVSAAEVLTDYVGPAND